MIGVAVVGYGYWGPNLVRNFSEIPGARMVSICDLRNERLATARARYPAIEITDDFEQILRDRRVDAIAIATPVSSHYRLAMKALMAGKHVLVEKPMTASTEEAQRLIDEAARRRLVLAVDHTFLHTAAVRKMRDLVKDGLGEIYYYDAVRVNLGLFQHDVSVIWDLAVHDLSILDFVLQEKPVAVRATGMSHVVGEPENIAYLNLFFESKLIAHIHVNWLAPVKIRRTLIGGSRKMVLYDDVEPSEKLKVYDKGITLNGDPEKNGAKVYQMMVGYRAGDMWAPQLDLTEALATELTDFVTCIESGRTPLADGQAGLRIVRVLEAASQSLMQRGHMIELELERWVA